MTSLCFQRSRIVCQIQNADNSSRQPEPRLPVETRSWSQALKCKMEVFKIIIDMKQIMQLRFCCFMLFAWAALNLSLLPFMKRKDMTDLAKAINRSKDCSRHICGSSMPSTWAKHTTVVIFFVESKPHKSLSSVQIAKSLKSWSLGVLKRFCREGAASKTAA